MPHIGTGDVDIGLDPSALGDGEYAVRSLSASASSNMATINGTICGASNSYAPYQPADDGPDIDVVIDFLMPRDAEITRNTPPLISL